jgi:thymidylate synthase
VAGPPCASCERSRDQPPETVHAQWIDQTASALERSADRFGRLLQNFLALAQLKSLVAEQEGAALAL